MRGFLLRCLTLLSESLVGTFVDLNKGFRFEGEDVHFPLAQIGPQGLDLEFFAMETFAKERIREKLFQLFQGVDLREFIRRLKFIVRIDEGVESALIFLSTGEGQFAFEVTGALEFAVLFHRASRVFLQPLFQRTVVRRFVDFVAHRIQQIHCFAIGMSEDDDHLNVVSRTGQFQSSTLAADGFSRFETMVMRNEITCSRENCVADLSNEEVYRDCAR